MLLSFTQVADAKQGKVTAALVPRSETPTERRTRDRDGVVHRSIANPVRRVTREFLDRDESGHVNRTIREPLDLFVTIIAFEPKVLVYDLDPGVALLCGYGGDVEAMRDEWRRRHPRMDLACLLHFAMGDTRDPDRYLTHTRSMKWDVGDGRGGTGDYTTNSRRSSDEAAALSRQQLEEQAKAKRSAKIVAEKQELRDVRDAIARNLERLEIISAENDEIEASKRRLERELIVLDRKIDAL